VPDTDRATVIDDVNGTRRPVTTATGGRSRATAAHLRPAGGHGSPSAREITSFSTPLAEGRLYEEDRGGSSDPVQGVLQCVQELEVRPGVHIGC
jgi:hypothetical protein